MNELIEFRFIMSSVFAMMTNVCSLSVTPGADEASPSKIDKEALWARITDNFSVASSLWSCCQMLLPGDLTYELSEILMFVQWVEKRVQTFEVEWFERGCTGPRNLMDQTRLAARQVIAESYWRGTPREKLVNLLNSLVEALEAPCVTRHKCIDVAVYTASTIAYILCNEAF
jgi:hypothetical protein